MKTKYFKDENGKVYGNLYTESRSNITNIKRFDPITLPSWFPASFSFELVYNKFLDFVGLKNIEDIDCEVPYGTETYKDASEFPQLDNWYIERIHEGNASHFYQFQYELKASWYKEPGTYTSKDVQESIETVTSIMDIVLTRLYADYELTGDLPKLYNYEGVALLYQLIKNPKLDPKALPIELKHYSPKFGEVEVPEETKEKLASLQGLYLMLQECRKIAKAYEG